MVENRPLTNLLAHLIMILGVIAIMFPVWMMIVAASHDATRLLETPLPLLPGDQLWHNITTIYHGDYAGPPVFRAMLNSLIMALGITIGKITICLMSAYAIVYFRFPMRKFFFWLIFITLMLPVEVRIVPTFEVAASLNLLNSYAGLILPLIASATATFLFRQTFLTIPEEMLEAARIDGAGPLRFFFDILIPLSRTNIAALFVILFIYGWNQYLWPLITTTDGDMTTIVMSIKNMLSASVGQMPQWNLIMLVALLGMLPPIIVVILMQKAFVKGLTETEK